MQVNYLEELFTSVEIWGLGGPLLVIVIGYFVAKKDRTLGALYTFIIMFVTLYYFDLFLTVDAWFIWHGMITLFGGLFVCVFPLFDQ